MHMARGIGPCEGKERCGAQKERNVCNNASRPRLLFHYHHVRLYFALGIQPRTRVQQRLLEYVHAGGFALQLAVWQSR